MAVAAAPCEERGGQGVRTMTAPIGEHGRRQVAGSVGAFCTTRGRGIRISWTAPFVKRPLSRPTIFRTSCPARTSYVLEGRAPEKGAATEARPLRGYARAADSESPSAPPHPGKTPRE
jgi:hypothetical protein